MVVAFQAFHSIAKCSAVLCVARPEQGIAVVTQLMAEIKVLCLSVCLSVCVFVGLCVCQVSLFVCLYVCVSVCLFGVCLSVCLHIFDKSQFRVHDDYLSVCLSVWCLSVCLSVCLFGVCLSV